MNLTVSHRAVLMDKLMVHISVNKYDIRTLQGKHGRKQFVINDRDYFQ